MPILAWLYALTLLALAVYGLHLLALTALAALAWLRRARRPARVPEPSEWPTVLVQLPMYNERAVAVRLIDAALALDYPPDRLWVQVLDDSTDDTARLTRARVAWHAARGRQVTWQPRARREGFKAGALAAGLAGQLFGRAGQGQARPLRDQPIFVAVFDADFVPPADFLRRLIPRLLAEPRLGMVQARWEHLNPDLNAVTRAQALALDGYFTVDQVARSERGLLLNFNGSAGVWRRACIEDAGGWQGDTLAEDLDLSYRAQLRGWRLAYAPDVSAPAELPPGVLAFKRQQARWAQGSFQVLRKLGGQLARAPQPLWRKIAGFLHLSGYLPYPLMVAALLLSLPLALWPVQPHGLPRIDWGLVSLAGLGLPLSAVMGQALLRARLGRLWHYPVLILLGIGLAVVNTRALWRACFGGRAEFLRTPKGGAYALGLDWTSAAEAGLALYALLAGLLAVRQAPALAPFALLSAAGLGFTAARGLWEALAARAARLPSAEAQAPDRAPFRSGASCWPARLLREFLEHTRIDRTPF